MGILLTQSKTGTCGSFGIVLMLLLSQNVLRSFQCLASHRAPVTERRPITITVESVEDLEKRSEQRSVQVCDIQLVDIIIRICGRGNFVSTNVQTGRSLSKRADRSSWGGLLGRRMKRSKLYENCCFKACSTEYLETFCRDPNKMPRINQIRTPAAQAFTEPKQPEVTTSQAPAQPPETDPNPVIYYPLFHFIQLLNNNFAKKPTRTPILIPLARSRPEHLPPEQHLQPTTLELVDPDYIQAEYTPRDHERFEGNPFDFDNPLTDPEHHSRPNRFDIQQASTGELSWPDNIVTSTFAPKGATLRRIDDTRTDDDSFHVK